jgi:serine/threonine protein kinase
MNRCPSCGTKYPDDARFCTRDGSQLLPVADSPPSAGDASTGRLTNAPARSDAATKAGATTLAGSILDGRYRVARKIGEGGMSSVYLAADIASGEQYAIKVLSAALSQDSNAMQRLKREASMGMRLAHDNICHIIRLGETEDGMVYVVMPYLEGEILADRTNRLGHIPLADTVRLISDIAAGLHVAHELKIVHRDLKPENIMVARGKGGAPERAVVMDFGLAKERRADAELQKLTATGIILGTPEFMSPEQLRGKPLDSRTDVYSLSLMTYEMLTGRLPFQGKTQQELMIARLRSDPIPLRQMRPELGLPEAVEAVLAKALKRNPDERHQSTPEFAQALVEAARVDGEGGLLGRLFGRS